MQTTLRIPFSWIQVPPDEPVPTSLSGVLNTVTTPKDLPSLSSLYIVPGSVLQAVVATE